MKAWDFKTTTNRELWEQLKDSTDKEEQRQIMCEMAKRVHRYEAFCWHPTKALREEIKQIFSQYKLNGAGCETH